MRGRRHTNGVSSLSLSLDKNQNDFVQVTLKLKLFGEIVSDAEQMANSDSLLFSSRLLEAKQIELGRSVAVI